MAEELSKYGEDYGAALCLPPNRAALPFDQLTPAEQQCVRQVGTAVENRVLERFGVNPPGQAMELYRYTIQGPKGTPLGTLNYADGALSVCWNAQSTTAPTCDIIGHGHDALLTALRIYRDQGFTVTESS